MHTLIARTLAAACLMVAGCSKTPDADTATPAASPTSTSAAMEPQAGNTAIIASRAEVEQAWLCRGVTSAAWAARKMLKDGLPDGLSGFSTANATFWNDRAARMKTTEMTTAELDALVARSTRVFVSEQAFENALPQITECLVAQKSLASGA